VLAEELRITGQLTRTEITAVLEKAGIEARGIRLGLILTNAELNGVICSGVPKGKQQTYALLDERAPEAVNLTHEQALAELTRRYFTSHGPATVKDSDGGPA
jgi:Winged helix DNA-binding domain